MIKTLAADILLLVDHLLANVSDPIGKLQLDPFLYAVLFIPLAFYFIELASTLHKFLMISKWPLQKV